MPKLNEDSRQFTFIKNQQAIKRLSKMKTLGPNGFIAEFYQILQEKQTPIFFKLFHKTENTGTLTNSCYKASLTLIPKPEQTKKTTRPITPMNIYEKFSI